VEAVRPEVDGGEDAGRSFGHGDGDSRDAHPRDGGPWVRRRLPDLRLVKKTAHQEPVWVARGRAG
jgi:hypothetical protein